MAQESKFQILTIGEEGEVGSKDLTDMMKSVSESDPSIDVSSVTKLGDLDDVLLSSGLEDLQAILYDESSESFVNRYIMLTDLIEGVPTDQNILKWDASSESFIPVPISEVAGIILDDETLTGANTQEDPLRIHPDVIAQIDNSLKRDYAHFKVAADENSTPSPPLLANGELVYYTNQYLKPNTSIKVTEHVIEDWLGNKTVIKSTEEVL